MKKRKTKLQKLICCLTIVILMSGCSSLSNSEELTESNNPKTNKNEYTTQNQFANLENETESETANKPLNDVSDKLTQDVYEEKINYYMQLVESLQSEILTIKQENFINEVEYKKQIESLEQNIQTLLRKIDLIQTGNTTAPSPQLPGLENETSSNNDNYDNIVHKSEFEYQTVNGSIIITGYRGSISDVTIPSVIDGLPVTEIGESAFKNTNITSVYIPSSVNKIGWFAFSGCVLLEKASIPSSVVSVDYGAFDYCSKKLTIYGSIGSYIEQYARSWSINFTNDN